MHHSRRVPCTRTIGQRRLLTPDAIYPSGNWVGSCCPPFFQLLRLLLAFLQPAQQAAIHRAKELRWERTLYSFVVIPSFLVGSFYPFIKCQP